MPLNPIGLHRYDSAPESFISNLIPVTDDVNFLTGRNRFFPPGDHSHCLTSESSCNTVDLTTLSSAGSYGSRTEIGMHSGSYYTNASQIVGDPPMSSGISSQLFRHNSLPAELLSDVMFDDGVTVTNGDTRHFPAPILKSQRSFPSRHITSMSHTSTEISTNDTISAGNVGRRYMPSNYQLIDSWDDHVSNSFVISAPPPPPPVIKHGNNNNGDFLANHGNVMDTNLEDNVLCRIRAKRGCATHPRSIAERERRTKISEKLRKLQEIVPNMDKQTSTADMLDLAVQYIKGLQSQIQTLNEETAKCTCSSKKDVFI